MRRLLIPVLVCVVIAGCFGGGGGGEVTPPTAGPTPTRAPAGDADRAYARAVCSAFGTYLGAMGRESQRDPQLFSDQAKLLRVAAPILETFGKDLNKAKPPKDVSNFHTALVQRVETIAKKAKAAQVVSTQELSNISKGAPLPPVTVRGRLAEAARGIPECEQSGGMDAFFNAPETD